MQWTALLGVLVALLCPVASAATTTLFPSQPGVGTRAVVRFSQPKSSNHRLLRPIKLELNLGGVEIEKNQDGFHSIKVDGLAPIGKVGYPDLLTTGILFAVPEGVDVELRIKEPSQTFLREISIAPCQKRARCNLSPAGTSFSFQPQAYESTEPYPPNTLRLEELGTMQGLRLVRAAFYPVQMQAGGLLVTTQLSAEIHFHNHPAKRKISRSFANLATSIAANGEDIQRVSDSLQNTETLLIILPDEFEQAIAPLVHWKRQRGLNVVVAKTSKTGSDTTAIKKFIQTFYNASAPAISYLLLVGNKQSLPGFDESTGMGRAASDYSYSLLDGSDPIPDVFYGRLLADSEAEVKTQVARWIDYEMHPSGDWYTKAITLASDQGIRPSDADYANDVKQALSRYTYRQVDTFLQKLKTATQANIFDALKEGRSWLSYFGHGTGTEWTSTNQIFSNAEVEKIENQNRLPFVVDVACENAAWTRSTKCFGKSWMTATSGGVATGAIAYLGGSVKVSWNEPALMSIGIAKYHFERPVHTIGASVFAGQMYLLEKMGMEENVIDNLRWYNLFGDPSLLARTDTPKEYSVSYSTQDSSGFAAVEVVANDSTKNAVAGLTTSLWIPEGSELLATATTDSTGKAILKTPLKSLPHGALLTVSGYNFQTYQTEITR